MTSGEPEPEDENSNALANERRPLIDQNPNVRVHIEPIKLNVRAPELLRLLDNNPEARVEIVVGGVNLNSRAAGPPPVTDQESYADDVNEKKTKAQSLRLIDEDPEKKQFLQNWETERSEFNTAIILKSRDVDAIKADMYQFIGIYSAFQGVIITAVALSSTLSCKLSWAPGLLSLFASVVTLASVYFKLDYYHEQKNIVHVWTILGAEMSAQIDDFKFTGDFPDEKNGDIRDKRNHRYTEEKLRKLRQRLEMALTLTILATFSLFVFASCFVMLCPMLR